MVMEEGVGTAIRGGWHRTPGMDLVGLGVAFGFGIPFWGWGYPYAPYGYGYYPYAYAPVYAPRVYEGHVVARQQPVDAKDVSSPGRVIQAALARGVDSETPAFMRPSMLRPAILRGAASKASPAGFGR